ncbi:uncharacterized protein LOC112500273 isoform X1 [Cynara cardunculus var. scolymus]|nr:uncharacterized protein LOC112500273 isoform X1 [Cynara cardunculus var. scolymus]
MAGGNPLKAPSNKPSSSSSSSHHRKSHRESGNNLENAAQKPSPSKPPTNSKPSPSSKHKPSPKLNPNPNPNPSPRPRPENVGPPPPPAYGFHMLDRRTIVLADGSVRSYFALPLDYQDFTPPLPRPPMRPQGPESWLGFDRQFPHGPPIPGGDDRYRQQNQDYWNSLGLEGSRKRKYGDERDGGEINDEFARQRQQLLQYGNNSNGSYMAGPSSLVHLDEMRAAKYMRPEGGYGSVQVRHNEIDQAKFKRAFLNFIRSINENASQKKKYLADGKQGSLQCLACDRSSKDFPDMHSLIMHTYNPEKATSDHVPDHLGLHKALCILMGWNYLMPPDNSKAYQLLSAEEAAADRDDLIMWPPHVIIQNTITGKGRDGRMEGLGNKAMDMKLRDFGFSSGKSKSMYGREGHMGTSVVKFAGDQSGLRDAMRLADFFEKQKHGRVSWASVQSLFRPGKDDEKDPNLVKLDKKSGQKERILYGYLGTVFDMESVDFDTRKKVTIESKRERAQAQPN